MILGQLRIARQAKNAPLLVGAPFSDLLLGGMISPLPSHSPHTALLCCTIPGPICDQSKRIILQVKNSEQVILNKTSTIFDPPHLDRLDLDPPALAACARLHIGAALPPAVVAHAVPRGCQLPRLEEDNICSLLFL